MIDKKKLGATLMEHKPGKPCPAFGALNAEEQAILFLIWQIDDFSLEELRRLDSWARSIIRIRKNR